MITKDELFSQLAFSEMYGISKENLNNDAGASAF